MSLSFSTTGPSQDTSFFIRNTGTADAPVIPTGNSTGALYIERATTGPLNGDAFLRTTPGGETLSVGVSDARPTQITCQVTPFNAVFLNENTYLNQGATALYLQNGADLNVQNTGSVFLSDTATLTVNEAIVATANPAANSGTLVTKVNRNISGYSDIGYVYFAAPPQAAGPIPNPPYLPVGLYSVVAAAPGNPNIGAQVSATCYWDGAAWTGSGVSVTFTAGDANCAIYPANGSATLVLGGSGGGATVPAGTVVSFRQLLGRQVV